MDVVIKIKDGKFTTNFYYKPADGHQYLHYYPCHAEHINRSIVFSQTVRLRRICSEKNDLDSNVKKRGDPEQLIKAQMVRAFQFASNNNTNNSKQENETGVPLVTKYHRRFKNQNSFTKRNIQYFYVEQEVKNIYTHAPFISFRSARKFKEFVGKIKSLPLG